MAVDPSVIVGLTVQLNALQQAKQQTTDPAAKSLIDAQIAMLTAQISAEAQHQQSQVDSSNNILNAMGLFQTLTSAVGNAAPSIISLFTKK